MVFFVPPQLVEAIQERNKNQSQNDDPEIQENFELLLLANGKKMGMTFEEINMFRLVDFIQFTNIYFAEPKKPENETKARQASQEDIDRFYA